MDNCLDTLSYKIGSILLISVLVLGLASNSIIQKSDKTGSLHIIPPNTITGIAFAESDDNNTSSSEHNDAKSGEQDSSNDSNDNNQTEHDSEDNNLQLNEEINQTQSEQNKENMNETEGENQLQANQEGIDEIDDENNNKIATHEENEQDSGDIENAKENKTIAAEVNIGSENEETKLIDDNIDVHVNNSTSDTVSVTVDSKTESGPKVIVFNLNSTTIDVANIKYLHITYDDHSVAPAPDVNTVLHPKSTDEPSYAIIITQNGAQILVSIPHFSAHTITISKISKVIPPVPEFPIALLTLLTALIPIVMLARKISIYHK